MAQHQSQQRETSFQTPRWQVEAEAVSLSTAPPPGWQTQFSATSRALLRQILGLNPFKTSYFALYKPLTSLDAKLILLGGTFLAAAAGIPLPIIGVLFSKIINEFPPSEEELKLRIGQLLGIAIAYFSLTWGWALCWGMVGERVSKGLREAVVDRAMGMNLEFFDCEGVDFPVLLTDKIQTIQLGTSEKVGLFIQSISYFVAAFTVGFILNARLTGILFAAVIPAMAIIVCLGTKTVSRLSKAVTESSDKASDLAQSAIKAVQVVQAFGIASKISDDYSHLLTSRIRSGIRKSIAGATMLASVYFVAYAANALAFWEGYKEHAHSEDQSKGGAGTVYAVVFLILDASFVLGQFGPFLQSFALASAAGEKIFELLDHKEPEISVLSAKGDSPTRETFQDDIHLRNVSFSYPARPTLRVLEDLSVSFKAGSVNGIVGPSGSGKSTIASLLLRLYDPCSGTVSVGQTNFRTCNVSTLRSQMALVDQEPVLFSGTVLDNIRHGLQREQNLSEEQVYQACSKAAREASCDFIDDLPHGFHTEIGPSGGTQLSGGQKQRLCLARALVRNPRVLILDEHTSAMDAHTEASVMASLKQSSLESGRTTIIIAHRLVTIRDADKIFVMERGRLIDEGDHETLLNNSRIYKDLVTAQQLESPDHGSPESSLEKSARKLSEAEWCGTVQEEVTSRNAVSEGAQRPVIGIFILISKVLALTKPEAVFVVIGTCASVLAGLVVLGEAVVFGNLVHVLNARSTSDYLQDRAELFCLLFFVLSLIAFLAYFCSGSAFGVVSERLLVRIQTSTLQNILRQDLAWFAKAGQSPFELAATMASDASHMGALSGIILGTLLSVLTSVIGGILLAHIVAWKIAVVLLAAVPIMLIAGFLRLRVLARAERRQRTAYSRSTALVSEACAAIRTVAALGREQEIISSYKDAIRMPYEQSLGFTTIGSLLFAASFAVTYFVYALAYWWGAQQVRSGNYSDVQFFIVLPALLFSAQAAGQMFSLSPEITHAKAAARSVFGLQNQQPSISDGSHKHDAGPTDHNKGMSTGTSAGKSTAYASGQVDFVNVSLRYPNRPHSSALSGITISIRAGESVAFVGHSGAGKSSCVTLLERFYDATEGSILVGGVDIRNLTLQEHRARLGLVAQEADLFPGSVSFNVSLGSRPGQSVTQQDIIDVCKKCGLHEFIMGLPDGYNTECGKNGSRLSGGQRQRIAIARALIRDPEILLLDEATSQLDAQSEKEIQKVFDAASSGRTTITVTHRMASVQRADRIFVFDHGKFTEHGKHEELIALGGTYAAMVAAQRLCST